MSSRNFIHMTKMELCMHVRNKFFTVRQPKKANARGLYECFTRATRHIFGDDTNWETKLVGFGCDETSWFWWLEESS